MIVRILLVSNSLMCCLGALGDHEGAGNMPLTELMMTQFIDEYLHRQASMS